MKIDPKDYINKAIFITATNTDVGKTYACEKFLNFFAKARVPSRVAKVPIISLCY